MTACAKGWSSTARCVLNSSSPGTMYLHSVAFITPVGSKWAVRASANTGSAPGLVQTPMLRGKRHLLVPRYQRSPPVGQPAPQTQRPRQARGVASVCLLPMRCPRYSRLWVIIFLFLQLRYSEAKSPSPWPVTKVTPSVRVGLSHPSQPATASVISRTTRSKCWLVSRE